jgi:hypothetical protein
MIKEYITTLQLTDLEWKLMVVGLFNDPEYLKIQQRYFNNYTNFLCGRYDKI